MCRDLLFLRYNKYHAPFICIYKLLYLEHLVFFIFVMASLASFREYDFSFDVITWMYFIALGVYLVSSPLSFIAYCFHKLTFVILFLTAQMSLAFVTGLSLFNTLMILITDYKLLWPYGIQNIITFVTIVFIQVWGCMAKRLNRLADDESS